MIAIVKDNMYIQSVNRFSQHYFCLFLKRVFTSFLAQLHNFLGVFQIVVRGRGNPPVGGMEISLRGIFLPGGMNMRRSEFDHSNLFF